MKQLFLLVFMMFGVAFADNVPYPPPTSYKQPIHQAVVKSNMTPEQAFNARWGYDPVNRTIDLNKMRAETKRIKDRHAQMQTSRATFTDNYGNKTTGTIKTQTKLPETSVMAKAGAAYFSATAVSGAINSQGNNIGYNIAQGNYRDAAEAAVMGALQGMKDAGNAATFGMIGGFESIFNGYASGKNTTMQQDVQAAAQAKAQAAMEKAQANQAALGDLNDFLPGSAGKPKKYPNLLIWSGGSQGVAIIPDKISMSGGTYDISLLVLEKTGISVGVSGCMGSNQCVITSFNTEQVTPQNYEKFRAKIAQAVAAAANANGPTVEDFLLNQTEIQAAMLSHLEALLNAQNVNNEAVQALVSALWNNGSINGNNTETSVLGSPSDNTFLTAPYTPAGSNQAQQTQFVVNPDGTISMNIIPRPDLAANTSQAPTRQETGTNNTVPSNTAAQTNQQNQQSQQQDHCVKHPNSLACMDMGQMDYEDLKLPTQNIDLSFNPLNIFSSTGTCPVPTQFKFLGTSQTFSYENICTFAEKIRPFVILAAMLFAFFLVQRSIG